MTRELLINTYFFVISSSICFILLSIEFYTFYLDMFLMACSTEEIYYVILFLSFSSLCSFSLAFYIFFACFVFGLTSNSWSDNLITISPEEEEDSITAFDFFFSILGGSPHLKELKKFLLSFFSISREYSFSLISLSLCSLKNYICFN